MKTTRAAMKTTMLMALVLSAGVTTVSCSKEQLQRAGADMLRVACSDISKCTYRCPDGTETDPRFPRCDVP